MTRKQYIELRKKNVITNDCLWLYWKDHALTKMKMKEFLYWLGFWFKSDRGAVDTKKIVRYLDKKFSIKKITDQQTNKLLKIW